MVVAGLYMDPGFVVVGLVVGRRMVVRLVVGARLVVGRRLVGVVLGARLVVAVLDTWLVVVQFVLGTSRVAKRLVVADGLLVDKLVVAPRLRTGPEADQ